MNTKISMTALLTIMLAFSGYAEGQAIGPEFTYQGQLTEGGSAANGMFDMQFQLFASDVGGLAEGTQNISDVEVSDGNFTVELDFGADAFGGEARWLGITVEGTPLSPRQKITAAPYATYSSKTRGININADGSFVGVGRDTPFNVEEGFGVEVPVSGANAYGGINVGTSNLIARPFYGYYAGGVNLGRHFMDGAAGRWRLENRDGEAIITAATFTGLFQAAPSDFNGFNISVSSDDIGLGHMGGSDYQMNIDQDGFIGIRRDEPVVDGATGQSWFDITFPGNGDTVSAMYLDNQNEGARTNIGFSTNGVSKAVMTYDDAFNTWSLDIGPNVIDEINVNGNNGRVGIGTVSATALLDVNGSGRVRSNMDVDLSLDVGQNLFVSGNGFKPGGGFWSVLSDKRLKKNVHQLEGSLDKMMALRGVNFEYNDPKAINELEGERIGMIAQEVEKVFPDWVEQHSNGYKMLSIRGFEAVTIEAIRELRSEKDAQIKELQDENEDLRERLENLESALESLLAK